jgi:hypothetical protein
VLQTTNSGHPDAGGESRSGRKIPRLRGRAGSIPASGTNMTNAAVAQKTLMLRCGGIFSVATRSRRELYI